MLLGAIFGLLLSRSEQTIYYAICERQLKASAYTKESKKVLLSNILFLTDFKRTFARKFYSIRKSRTVPQIGDSIKRKLWWSTGSEARNERITRQVKVLDRVWLDEGQIAILITENDYDT